MPCALQSCFCDLIKMLVDTMQVDITTLRLWISLQISGLGLGSGSGSGSDAGLGPVLLGLIHQR